MGMPSDPAVSGSGSKQQGNVSTAGHGRIQELDFDEEDKDEDIQSLMQQMEAELNESGALNLDPTPRKIAATKQVVKGKASERSKQVVDDEEDEDNNHKSGDAEENDIDVNLARNLLESLKSQGGASGPGGNMMGLMGLKMPRDGRDEKR